MPSMKDAEERALEAAARACFQDEKEYGHWEQADTFDSIGEDAQEFIRSKAQAAIDAFLSAERERLSALGEE